MRRDKSNTDRKTDTIVRRRKRLRCDICPPNRGENRKSYKKYGTRKPKRKIKRVEIDCPYDCPPNCPGCEVE